ncbi:MAG: 1-deoxy-D-xylulose-5-phosphate reductoisomerase [Verrucomicrobiota bacterium JB022]|nr:1-deoxy-D-xylulose-5-phosphate reductoisomerase [Verrucomicrobiota bacterium JB022]
MQPSRDPKRLVLIGATGSIGQSTLEVIRANPHALQLVGVAANSNAEQLDAIAREFGVRHQTLYTRDGLQGLLDLVTLDEADVVLIAAVGTVGLRPALAAMEAGKDVALASKEVLVLAGEHVMAAAKRHNCQVLPIDSEHNAIFQCLQGCPEQKHVRRLILTASGGSFRNWTREQMAAIRPEDALKHPNWSMGPKITVDSSTMANKGLEMIEARWLFDVAPGQIDVVIHPQSIVHSMVEYVDGSILAQMSPPSMTFAIQHALLHPDRGPGVTQSLDFTRALQLDFLPPDTERFPCLRLAREAMVRGGAAPGIFNAANEVAVAAFLDERLGFLDIPTVVEETLQTVDPEVGESLDDLLELEAEARHRARAITARLAQSGRCSPHSLS